MYFYADGKEKRGPYTEEELVARFESGELDTNTLIWTDGMPDWQPASTTFAFAEPAAPPALNAPPPPLPVVQEPAYVDAPASDDAEFYTTDQPTFGRRALALVIDMVLITTVVGVLSLVLGFDPDPGDGAGPLQGLLSWLYFAGMESSVRRATVGKQIMGLEVIDYDGGRVSFWRATGRYFGKILSTIPLFFGFLMGAFTENKQTLHDMVSKTYVVRR